MKKIVFILMVALLGGNVLMAQTKPAKKEAVTYPIPMKKQKAERGNKVYDVADIYDVARIYRPEANPAQCFFVISKQEFRLVSTYQDYKDKEDRIVEFPNVDLSQMKESSVKFLANALLD